MGFKPVLPCFAESEPRKGNVPCSLLEENSPGSAKPMHLMNTVLSYQYAVLYMLEEEIYKNFSVNAVVS